MKSISRKNFINTLQLIQLIVSLLEINFTEFTSLFTFFSQFADPTSTFVYPACTRSSSAQKVFKIKLDYITEVLCNDAGKGVLKQNILEALQALNKEWNFVDDQQVSNCNKIAI